MQNKGIKKDLKQKRRDVSNTSNRNDEKKFGNVTNSSLSIGVVNNAKVTERGRTANKKPMFETRTENLANSKNYFLKIWK